MRRERFLLLGWRSWNHGLLFTGVAWRNEWALCERYITISISCEGMDEGLLIPVTGIRVFDICRALVGR